jgi:hypothetical protein
MKISDRLHRGARSQLRRTVPVRRLPQCAWQHLISMQIRTLATDARQHEQKCERVRRNHRCVRSPFYDQSALRCWVASKAASHGAIQPILNEQNGAKKTVGAILIEVATFDTVGLQSRLLEPARIGPVNVRCSRAPPRSRQSAYHPTQPFAAAPRNDRYGEAVSPV